MRWVRPAEQARDDRLQLPDELTPTDSTRCREDVALAGASRPAISRTRAGLLGQSELVALFLEPVTGSDRIRAAQIALAELPRCGACSRQTGRPCLLAGTGAGGRCRFHGGRAGRPVDPDSRRQARLQATAVRVLSAVVAQAHGMDAPHGGARVPGEQRLQAALQAVGIDVCRKRRR